MRHWGRKGGRGLVSYLKYQQPIPPTSYSCVTPISSTFQPPFPFLPSVPIHLHSFLNPHKSCLCSSYLTAICLLSISGLCQSICQPTPFTSLHLSLAWLSPATRLSSSFLLPTAITISLKEAPSTKHRPSNFSRDVVWPAELLQHFVIFW